MSLEFDNLLPDDENSEVLRRMERAGEHMEKAREIDFFFEFTSELNAEAFSREIDDPLAFASRHSMEEQFLVCVSKVLVPTYQEINEAQTRWTHLATIHHGKSDGWGYTPT